MLLGSMARVRGLSCSLTWAFKANSKCFNQRWVFNLILVMSKNCLRNHSLKERSSKQMKKLRKRMMNDILILYIIKK
jgi:uncharacterized membrane protein